MYPCFSNGKVEGHLKKRWQSLSGTQKSKKCPIFLRQNAPKANSFDSERGLFDHFTIYKTNK